MNLTHRIALRMAVVGAVLSSVTLASSRADAAGTAYWVDNTSPSCSDGGVATQTTPTCTIGAAVRRAVNPGDVVHVVAGAYREQVTLAGSGTATDPISVVADGTGVTVLGTMDLGSATWSSTSTAAWSTPYSPPAAPRQVLLDGSRLVQATGATSTTAGSWFYDAAAKLLYVDVGGADPSNGHTIEAGAQSYGFNVNGRANVVVSGFTARNQNLAGFRAASSPGVRFSNDTATGSAANGILLESASTGAVVDRAAVSGSLSTGIRVSGTTGAIIRASSSHDNGLHGIGLTTSPSATVTGNQTFANTSPGPNGGAVGVDVDSSSIGATVTGNRSHDNQDSGFQAYAGANNSVFARNVAWNNGDHGFATLNTTGVRYLNNTAWSNRHDGIALEGTSTGATLRNNITTDNGAGAAGFDLYADATSASGLDADHDVVYNHDTTAPVKVAGTTYRSLAAYATATGQEQHGLALAPAFVAPGSGDFHLQGGSPAMDSADSSVSGFVADDADGTAPLDDPLVPDTGTGTPSYADRGAYEGVPDPNATDYPPHAALIVSPTSLAVPPDGVVTADASGSVDADLHPITGYRVDFGDGSPAVVSPTPITTHAYTAAGTYTLTLTVTDGAGKTDTATGQVTVTARPLVTYQVARGAGCSDSGPGTAVTPFCTIAAATKVALAGDTIQVAPGQYNEQITPTHTGQAGAPLTIQATGPNTLISAAGYTYGILLRNLSHVVVSGFTVRDATLAGVDVDHGDHISLDHLDVAGSGSYGLTVDGTANATLSQITSARNGSIGVRFNGASDSSLTDATTHDNGLHGVSVQASSNVVVTRATSYANAAPTTRVAAGIDVSLGSSGTIVQDSTAYGNQDSGLESYSGATSTVFRRNLSYGNGDHGIDNNGTTGVQAISNTIVGNTTSGINFEGSSTGAFVRDNISANNALASPRTVGQIRVDASSVAGTSLNRDLVFGGTLFEWNGTRYTGIGPMRSGSGQELAGLAADPRFRDAAGNDFRLTAASPGIDAAFTGFALWQRADHDGNPPLDDPAVADTGSGPDPFADLGALEFGGPFAPSGPATVTATLSATPPSGYAPLTVTLDASGSSVSNGAAITSYTFNCGNGSKAVTQPGPTVTCRYKTAGTYKATVIARDAAKESGTASATVVAQRTAKLTAASTSTTHH